MSRTQNVCVNKSITKILLNRASEVAQTIRTKNNIKRLKSTGGGRGGGGGGKGHTYFLPFRLGVCLDVAGDFYMFVSRK